MSLPALVAARPDAVVVPHHLAELVPLAGVTGKVIPLQPGTRGLRAARPVIRRGRYERGILLAPSFSSALLFRTARVRSIRGADSDRRAFLLHDIVRRDGLAGLHRAEQYMGLATGERPAVPPQPRVQLPEPLLHRWRRLFEARDARVAGIFPGTRAPARRWEPLRFASVVRRLAAQGTRVIVFGDPSETELTRAVAGEWGFDAGGRTDIALLAAGLHTCHILVSNDTGPMHLAAAVGTPTVSLWGAGDPGVTGLTGPEHTIIRRTDLPCVPCVRNECPRQGPGTVLPEAHRECMNLIEVEDVMRAIDASMNR